MTRRDDDGRPAEWVTQLEPEFDANERDSWYALTEFEEETCPHCGNLTSVCSDPEGMFGEGYYARSRICWVTATRDNALRRVQKRHEKAQPDEAGFLPGDGLAVWAALENAPDDLFD